MANGVNTVHNVGGPSDEADGKRGAGLATGVIATVRERSPAFGCARGSAGKNANKNDPANTAITSTLSHNDGP